MGSGAFMNPYLVIGLCVAAVLIVGLAIFLIIHYKKKKSPQNPSEISVPVVEKEELVPTKTETYEVGFEEIAPEALPEEKELVEIKDQKLIAKIKNSLPTMAKNGYAIADSVSKFKASTETLYRAVIPAGEKLVESNDMAGAYRDIYMGANGIKGHANLQPVSNTMSAAGNALNVGMAIASFVVGQYYLHDINGQVDEIGNRLSNLENFQNNAFRSRVMGLLAQLKAISENQDEILLNEDLRKSKIIQLDALESSCIELLGQANLSLTSLEKTPTTDYKTYEKKIGEVEEWYDYQKPLLSLLHQIADLKYALHFGKVSREECNSVLLPYDKQTQDTQLALGHWHEDMMERLSVNLEKGERKRSGADKALHALPGLFDETKNYCPLENKTKAMLAKQSAHPLSEEEIDDTDFYKQDVVLFSKGSKYYYLLPKKNKKD
jgi:hypothetical protein